MRPFTLTIATVGETLFHGEAVSLTVPSTNGEITILANHEPIVSVLREGEVIVRLAEGEPRVFAVTHGAVEVNDNRVVVLL